MDDFSFSQIFQDDSLTQNEVFSVYVIIYPQQPNITYKFVFQALQAVEMSI